MCIGFVAYAGLSGLLIHQSKTEIKQSVYFNKFAFVAFVFAVLFCAPKRTSRRFETIFGI